jgi:hypothetical protein
MMNTSPALTELDVLVPRLVGGPTSAAIGSLAISGRESPKSHNDERKTSTPNHIKDSVATGS